MKVFLSIVASIISRSIQMPALPQSATF